MTPEIKVANNGWLAFTRIGICAETLDWKSDH
jgi:hypothetical protein